MTTNESLTIVLVAMMLMILLSFGMSSCKEYNINTNRFVTEHQCVYIAGNITDCKK